VAAAISRSEAPGLFLWVFGAAGLFLAWIGAEIAFKSTVVTVREGEITVTNPRFGIPARTVIPAGEVEAIRTEVRMFSGSVSYRTIEIHLRNGKKIAAGEAIRDYREAEWLAAEMERLARPFPARAAGGPVA